MLNKSVFALGALVVAMAAAPAFANTDAVFGASTDVDSLNFAKQSIEQRLEHRGLNVTNVDEWGGYVRADIQLADGSQATRYFEPGTLQPVAVSQLR